MKFLLYFLTNKIESWINKNMIIYFLTHIFLDSFAIEFVNEKNLLIGVIGKSDIPDEENMNPPGCKILGNWVFGNFILSNEPNMQKLYQFLKPAYELTIVYVENYFYP